MAGKCATMSSAIMVYFAYSSASNILKVGYVKDRISLRSRLNSLNKNSLKYHGSFIIHSYIENGTKDIENKIHDKLKMFLQNIGKRNGKPEKIYKFTSESENIIKEFTSKFK